MILLLDNYDSFTYNLAQYLRELGATVHVARNDAITLAEIETLAPTALVISPGGGHPNDAGITLDAIRACSGKIPVLGVGLGHLAIGVAHGAHLRPARQLMHGKVSNITCDGQGVFKGLDSRPFKAMCYHTFVLDPDTLPDNFAIAATSPDGDIMAIRHTQHPTHGLQFHPESIMTPVGKRILRNFLRSLELQPQ
ncbi:MAG: aminodeoxychorismate/anthranilate synthase component II [Lentisphaerae bacterium]|jgi:anthranilate synthase/aminodeoxychorismate synthase-like glutamine amidotransferase|nr:aminodeoxychorismate/anthranilate synthase component II [Lentisphaerota bacterium]